MRVVIAHPPGSNVQDLRQALHGAGLNCINADCVQWDDLPPRVAQIKADLLVVRTDDNAHANWAAVRESQQLTDAPIIAVGPSSPEGVQTARQSGARDYINVTNLRIELDASLAGLQSEGMIRPNRGEIVSVIAAAPGSGGTTVALNLAAAFARVHPQMVTLLEVAPSGADLANLLGLSPDHSAEEVFGRYQRLDAPSLRGALDLHSSGIRVLANSPVRSVNAKLDGPAMIRLNILARVISRFAVLALDGELGPATVEAMRGSDVILVVVRPDIPAVKRTQSLLAGLDKEHIPRNHLKAIVNRWGQPGQLTIAQVEAALGIPVGHRISEDPGHVNRAANLGELLVQAAPQSRIAREFEELAADLGGGNVKRKWWKFR